MRTTSHIHVRQLEVGDFDFVRDLAARQPNFTVPPPYVLWLLLKIKDAICLVAEDSTEGLLAYVLAVPIEAPARALYVWQLAASQAGQRTNATLTLLTEFREIAHQLRVKRVAFSTIPDSPTFRAIRRYAAEVFCATPQPTSIVPSVVCPNESEYEFELTESPRQIPEYRSGR
jgi:hypothetical protein